MTRQLYLAIFAMLVAFSTAFTVIPATVSGNKAPVASRMGSLTRIQAGPATLEPTTADPETIEKDDLDDKTQDESKYKKGGWAVRLFNDPMNKREFVAMCLSKITGLTDGQAYQVMMQAHQNGVSVVGRYDQERAELYRDSLRENGLTVDMIPVEED